MAVVDTGSGENQKKKKLLSGFWKGKIKNDKTWC